MRLAIFTALLWLAIAVAASAPNVCHPELGERCPVPCHPELGERCPR